MFIFILFYEISRDVTQHRRIERVYARCDVYAINIKEKKQNILSAALLRFESVDKFFVFETLILR